MKSIDNFVAGFKDGAQRREILAFCRVQSEEYHRGRAVDAEGKYVFDRLDETSAIEKEALGERVFDLKEDRFKRTKLLTPRGIGYVSYQLLHPIGFYQDNYLIADIVCGEVRPV